MHVDDDGWCDYMSSMNSHYRSFSCNCGFLFGCKDREGGCLRTVHSNRGGMGAALAQPNWWDWTIRIVHKKFRRIIKTKRLTRLSVYVERKNVCLQVERLLWRFCWPNFYLFLSSQYCFFFNSETVRREVKSEKWDFQDGRSGRNAIAFRNILWRKKVRKAGGIEEFALFLLVPPCPGTTLGESKQNSKFCFNHFF